MKCLYLLMLALLPGLIGAQPLFSLRTPQETHINFENTITDEKEHNILIYSNYYGGAGVGVGDFNQDGLMDLFFAGNLVPDRLYLNHGNWEFEDVTTQAGINDNGGWSSGVVVADVNNDGWPDIYVTRELYDEYPDLRKNLLYINQQDGTFKEMAADYGVDNSERTRHASFFDYDRDGWLDLILLNQPPNPGNYSSYFGVNLQQEQWAPRLLHNNGQGHFEDVSAKAGILVPGYPNSVTTADFNRDGWIDIYIANDYDAPDKFYLNNGDGTFTDILQEAMGHTSYYSMGVDAGDLNNDGWLDLMVLDMVAEDNFRLKSNMSGMNPAAFWKVVADGGHYQYMYNMLQLNNGVIDDQLNFSDIAQLAGVPSTDWSWSNLIADFDNDGWKDIHVTNGLLRDIRNSDASKEFPKYVQHVIDDFVKNNPNAGEVSIWDILDLDEALGLLPSVPLSNYAFRNNGDLTFTKVTKEWGLDRETFSNGSAYADLDNDGDLDLIENNINAPASLYENHINERPDHHFLRVSVSDQNQHRSLWGTRFRITTPAGQQFYELTNVRGMYSTSEPIAHFGLGKFDEVQTLEIFWPDGTQTLMNDVKAGQISVDYHRVTRTKLPNFPKEEETLFSTEHSPTGLSFVHRENDFNDFDQQVLLPHKMSQFGPAMATGDVNGDQLEDVYFGGATGKPGVLFIQMTNGSFRETSEQTWQEHFLSEDLDAVFFDVENDGDLDLYVVSGGNAFPQQSKQYQDRIYLNDGKGNFQYNADVLPKFRDSGGCVRPFDFDQDGDLDLFVGGRHTPWDYPSPAISRLLRNDNGSFTDVTKTLAPELIYLGLVTDAVWTDLDNDHQIELIVCGEWMPITLFKFQEGQLTKVTDSQALNQTTGWWYSIEAADMDGDGDQDLVAGNLGLNYKYKATTKEPFEVHYYDFDNNNAKDIVLSYYNFGEHYPLRGRSCSSEQVPVIKEKFETYNLFADANLTEVYGEDNLAKALHYKATTFASSYLENLGDGHFRVVPLPNEAQLSSTNDLIIKDFNEDRHLDILLAGNLFTSEIETTRNDAGTGMVLLGTGKGTFHPVSPEQSGLLLRKDLKKLGMLTIGGQQYIIGANNNDRPQFFKWHPRATAHLNTF